MFQLTILSLISLYIVNSGQQQIQSVGKISIPSPGLLSQFIHSNKNGTQKYSLLASSYSAENNTLDRAFMLVRPGEAMGSAFSGYTPNPLSNSLKWPKVIRQIPDSVFNYEAVAIPDGSTIAGKKQGNIRATLVGEPDFPTTYTLTDTTVPDVSSYNYADTLWLDNQKVVVSGMLSCRTKFNKDRLEAAQLVLYESPKGGSDLSQPWRPLVLKDAACDSHLALTSFQQGRDNWQVVYATGVFSKRLVVFWPETDAGHVGDWSEPRNIRSAIIAQGQEFYDVHIRDVNGDGKQDLLATIVAETGGKLGIWEIPDDFRNVSQYKLHMINSGFSSRVKDGRAPGVVKTFHPDDQQTGKPWILLSGGDDGRAYYIQPLTESSDDWYYQMTTFADEGGNETVAGVEVADVDGDGFTEIFVSVHGQNLINVYNFKK